nr:MAG TPA_asm: hypothetical protein [Caudoviricetes sp.]
MLDSGLFAIYAVKWDESGVSKTKTLEQTLTGSFEDRTVGVTRNYEAARNGHQADRLIRIWRTPQRVRVNDVCAIGGIYYHVIQVQYTTDAEGLLVTDLTLEETDVKDQG